MQEALTFAELAGNGRIYEEGAVKRHSLAWRAMVVLGSREEDIVEMAAAIDALGVTIRQAYPKAQTQLATEETLRHALFTPESL